MMMLHDSWKSSLSALGLWGVCLGNLLVARGADPGHDVSSIEQARHPVVLVRQGRFLLVGNRRSGTISLIDGAEHAVLSERVVATRIADMASLGDTRDLLVVDDAQNRLIRVTVRQDGVTVHPLAGLPRGATKLVLTPDSQNVFISCRWEHCVVALKLDSTYERVRRRRVIEIPFVPRELVLLSDHRTLLVADAFGSRLAVVDTRRGRVDGVHRIDGHNIRGLAVSSDGKRLHVAHQRMAARARADYEELHWGRLISNAVEVFDLDQLLASSPTTATRGWMDAQGGIGDATGDPGGVIIGPDGFTATTFSGMGEVAVRYGSYVKRLRVQRRPEAMAYDQQHLYVANRFDDSVSVIDLSGGEVRRTIVLGPRAKLDAVGRG
ncbi:MAG: hypothetical protein ABGZ17_20245, partial [Planctomycetaceae bacterium]